MIPNEKRITVRFNTFPSKFSLDVPFDKSDLNDKQIEGPIIHVNLQVENDRFIFSNNVNSGEKLFVSCDIRFPLGTS